MCSQRNIILNFVALIGRYIVVVIVVHLARLGYEIIIIKFGMQISMNQQLTLIRVSNNLIDKAEEIKKQFIFIFYMGQKCCSEIPQQDYERLRNQRGNSSIDVPMGLQSTIVPNLPFQVQQTRNKLKAYQPRSLNRPIGSPSDCKIVNQDGTVYQGQWKDLMPHGLGVMYFSDGSIYEGLLFQGTPDIEGRLINTNGVYYQGGISEGMANGKGKFHNHHKNYTYEGQWVQDIPHGFGKETWDDGTTFEGQFERGVKDGSGTYNKMGDLSYTGIFQSGKVAQKGKLTLANGNQYEGMFKNGVLEGHGICRYRDGSIYEGLFQNGQKNGKGVYTTADGSLFEGLWKNGKRNGRGKLKPAGSTEYIYWEWKNDVPIDHK